MADPAGEASEEQAGSAKVAESGGDGGKRDRKTQVIVALIGAASIVAGAVIGVVHPWSSSGVLDLGIGSIIYPVVNDARVVVVTGTVQNLGGGEYVYAFDGRAR